MFFVPVQKVEAGLLSDAKKTGQVRNRDAGRLDEVFVIQQQLLGDVVVEVCHGGHVQAAFLLEREGVVMLLKKMPVADDALLVVAYGHHERALLIALLQVMEFVAFERRRNRIEIDG